MADSAVKSLSRDKSPEKEEESRLKGESIKGDSKQNDQQKQNNPTKTTFSWTGKRKSDPLDGKPLLGPKGGTGITIKLGTDAKKKKQEPIVQKKAGSVAAVFGDNESDEEEEIPPEAKMRMRNIGRDTPTSSGPNSFNKGKRGFTHHGKVFEKKLKEMKPP